jgi:hypothetical protein
MEIGEIASITLRALGTLAGALMLYAAFFLYPGERKTLHNRLEDWWVRLDDARAFALRREPVVIQGMARTAHRGFEWLFGDPLSTRFFVVSGLLSMVSFTLAMSTFGDYGWAVPTGLLLFTGGTAFAVLQFGRMTDELNERFRRDAEEREARLASLFAPRSAGEQPLPRSTPMRSFAGLEPTPDLYVTRPTHSLDAKSGWDDFMDQLPGYLVVAITSTSSTGLVLAGARDRGIGAGVFFWALATAFTCAAASILVTMAVLEKLTKARNVLAAVGWLLLDALAAAAMLFVPLALFLWAVDHASAFGTYLLFVASANIATAVPSAAYLLVAAVLLAHRALWPLVLRPFYNVMHAGEVTKPKVLGAAGGALLLAAWPQVFAPLHPLVKALLDVF